MAIDLATETPAPTRQVSRNLDYKASGIWIMLPVSLVLFAWSAMQILAFDPSVPANTTAVTIPALVWLCLFLYGATRCFNTPYLWVTACASVLFVFHFGLIAQDGLGIVEVISYRGDFGAWAVLAGWYANLACASLGLGFAGGLLAGGDSSPRLSVQAANRVAVLNMARLRNLSIGLWFACGAFFLLAIIQLGNILSYDRFALFFSGLDTRGIGLFNWIAPSAALGIGITARTRTQRFWSYLVVLFTLLVFLLSGNRSMALFPLLVGIVLWVKTGRRIPPWTALVIVLVTLVAIPALGALRMMGSYNEFTFETFARASKDSSISAALAEMGGSSGTLAITLKAIPSEEPYRLGKTYLKYLRHVIPNVTGEVDRSEDPRLALQTGGSMAEVFSNLSPARWASVKVHGIQAAIFGNQGVGYSAVAEPYMNFGFPGVVLYFIALGLLLARMDRSNMLIEYRWLVFSTFFFWHFLITVRNEFGNFTKPAAFLMIIIGIWVLVRRFTPFRRP